MKNFLVQARIDQKDKGKFEEIRSIIHFERMKGNHLTPIHFHSKEDKITDSDVIRFLIKSFKFED